MLIPLFFLCLICCIVSTNGIKETYSKVKSGIYGDYLANDFGMAVGGRITVDYTVGPTNASRPFDSYLLLLVVSSQQKGSWYGGLGNSDSDVSKNINTLCNQPAMLRKEMIGTGKIHLDIDYSLGVDEYSVAVLQCREGYKNNPVNIDITLIMRNARPDSDEFSHFPIQQVMEVRVLQGELIVYALLILGMVGQMYVAGRYARQIHYVFLLTLVATFIFFFIKYGTFYEYNRTGVTNVPITIAQNVFGVISNGMFLLSLLLLSVGWTMIRSSLMAKEIQVIQISISAYWVFGIAGAVCTDADSSTCVALNLIPFILQSLILLGIIIAMNFSVTQLRAMVHNSPWVPSTPLQYARHQQYHVFRLVFLLYLLLPTAFLIFRVTQFGWKEDWVSFVLADLLDIALIFHVGVTFSPLHEALLTRAFDGSVIGQEAHIRADVGKGGILGILKEIENEVRNTQTLQNLHSDFNPKLANMALEMDLVRSVVAKIRFVEEVAQNPLLKTLTYVNTQKGHRIMVYCRKSRVVSTIHHPKVGNIQLVSRDVTYSTLVELLKNPPKKEDQQNTNTIGQKRLQIDINNSDPEHPPDSTHSKTVITVTPTVIAQTTRSKNPFDKKPSKAPVDNLEDEAEFDTEAPASEHAGVPPPSTSPEVAVVEPEETEEEPPLHKSRKVNARGNNSYWKLRYSKHFPTSATTVACFAQSHGGYVAVFDDGTCVYQGIPASVVDVIVSQRNRNIAYVAIGEYEQYYVRTRNGRKFYSGSPDFEDSIRRAHSTARLVAFGDASSYVILFDDGTRDTHAILPRAVLKILSEYTVNSVWIGTQLVHNANAYFVSYQGTTGGTLHTCAGLPTEVNVWLEKKALKSTQVKQLLSDGDCFIIRYS